MASSTNENVDICGTEVDSAKVEKKLIEFVDELREAVQLVSQPNSQKQPYKNIYSGIEKAQQVKSCIQNYIQVNAELKSSPLIKLTLIHVYSSLAKWHESCDELSSAEDEHKLCIGMVEQLITPSETDPVVHDENYLEISKRCRFMLTYEYTRYAILCSERDDQEKALELLKKAEEIYHKGKESEKESIPPENPDTLLAKLDSLNSECSKDIFTYVLFYLGQAYRITGEKEKAVLYLHMVLRRQLEKGDYSSITWSADTARMASVVMINMQAFETARNILLAATVVLQSSPEEEKSGDLFKENWADLGRCWVKLGVELLEASSDRLKDIGEQTRKPVKFCDVMKFTPYEKMSLEISDQEEEFNTLLLIKSLTFPTLDVAGVQEVEMRGKFVRDYDEARAVFLPLQRWVGIAKEHYIIDEHASDYIDIMTDYSNAFKYLAFFEPNMDRQIKMHRRRIAILEDLLTQLNSKAFADVFIHCLRELAEIYEQVYNLKVTKTKEKGESLRPKDQKLVKILIDAVGAHKRNLMIFDFDMKDPSKSFPADCEKTLLGSALSSGRILGSISHDHPLHPQAMDFAEEGKLFYKFFLEYVERRPNLKEDLKVLYDCSREVPELLDIQIQRIKQRLRGLTLS